MSFTILIPIDFSEVTELQIESAIPFCRAKGVEILLLHLLEPNRWTEQPRKKQEQGGCDPVERIEVLRAKLDAKIQGQANVTAKVKVGSPADTILSQIHSTKSDLVILGSQNHPPLLSTICAGSVARSLLLASPVPILLVLPGADPLPPVLQQITLGVDFGPSTGTLLHQAEVLARRVGANLRAVHITRPPKHLRYHHDRNPTPEDLTKVKKIESYGKTKFRRLLKFKELTAEDFDYAVEVGESVPKLLELGTQSDLLILGSHGHGRCFDLIMGSVSRTMIQKSKRPVLIVPVGVSQEKAEVPYPRVASL